MPLVTNQPVTFRQDVQPTLVYGPVTLLICRLLEYTCVPENDYANADYLGIYHITLGVQAIVNPNATASLTDQGAPGLAGDRAGFTIANLQDADHAEAANPQLLDQLRYSVHVAADRRLRVRRQERPEPSGL